MAEKMPLPPHPPPEGGGYKWPLPFYEKKTRNNGGKFKEEVRQENKIKYIKKGKHKQKA